jgi:hypothetical protein
MTRIVPSGNLSDPIPNEPFYSEPVSYVEGAYSPVIIGEGLRVTGDYLETAVNNTEAIIEDTTFYVALTGSDTEGDGSQGNPWASPHKAMEVLSQYTIWRGVTVTIQCAAGAYTFGTPINLDHPYGNQIQIRGAQGSGRPSPNQLTAGGLGYNPTTIAYTQGVVEARYPTNFVFDMCNGFEAFNVSGVFLTDLLISAGTDTPNTAGVCAGTVLSKVGGFAPSYRVRPSTAMIRLGNVAIWGWTMAGVVTVGGTVTFEPTNGVVTACGDNGGYFGGGLLALSNGLISPSDCYVTNSQWGWAAAEGGTISAASFGRVWGNQNGIYVAVNGIADISNGNATFNVDTVLKIANGGVIRGQSTSYVGSSTFTQTGNFAEVNGAGLADLRNSNFPLGSVFDPPVDTIGNGLGFIRTV